jgi:hypothetical protein
MWTTAGLVLLSALAAGAMEYVKLGSSNLKVSKVCLGTMTWGQQNTPQEGIEQLNYAFSMGVNFLDTAEIYPVPTKSETQGDTDRVVAQWLKTVDRSKVVLASKVAGHSDQLTYMPGRNGLGTAVNAQQIKASVEKSLERLETPYIDLLQIHWPERYVPLFGGGKLVVLCVMCYVLCAMCYVLLAHYLLHTYVLMYYILHTTLLHILHTTLLHTTYYIPHTTLLHTTYYIPHTTNRSVQRHPRAGGGQLRGAAQCPHGARNRRKGPPFRPFQRNPLRCDEIRPGG